MKKSNIVWIIIAGVLILLALNSFSQYNRLVRLDEQVNAQWAQVETNLQRRLDLIPNLVNTVKGYAQHESSVFREVTEARAKVGAAQSPTEAAQADQQLNSALSRLLVVVENYPELKANQNFLDLQAQLEGAENRISQSRRMYNESVREYNVAIRGFPTVLYAGAIGFKAKPFFEASERARTAPEVKF